MKSDEKNKYCSFVKDKKGKLRGVKEATKVKPKNSELRKAAETPNAGDK